MENKDVENRILKDLRYLKKCYNKAPLSMKEKYANAIREISYILADEPSEILSYYKELQLDYIEYLKYYNEFDYAKKLCFYFNSIEPLKTKTKVFFTKDELLELTHDFYKTTNLNIYFNFMKEFKNRKTDFIYKSTTNIKDAVGATFSIPFFNKSYIVIKREKSILPIMTSIHEYGHAINNQQNKMRNTFDNSFLDELYPLFFELIAVDYLNEIMDTPNINRYNATRACTYITNATLTNTVNILAEANNKKKIHDINILLKKTKGLKIANDDIKKYIKNSNTVTDLTYSLSYMTAIELYQLYQKDKDYTLELLKRIGTKNHDQFKEALKYLNVGDSLPKYLAKVKKENC